MYKKILKVIVLLLSLIVLLSFLTQSIHYLFALNSITIYSNILDGMPFYYGTTNYYEYIKGNFLYFFSTILMLTLMAITYFILIKFLTIKLLKIKHIKNVYLIFTFYLTVLIGYYEFFANISPTGPGHNISSLDFSLRIILGLFLPVLLFILDYLIHRRRN